MDLLTKNRVFSILVLLITNQSCQSRNEESIYYTNSSIPFSKLLIKSADTFNFPDPRDSTKVFVKNEDIVFTISKDTIFYERVLLTPIKNEGKIIEASNYEGGNFQYCSNFNYDLKFNGKKIDVNIHYPEQLKGSYTIKLDTQRQYLFFQSLIPIMDCKDFNLQDSINFDKSQLLILVGNKYKLSTITDKNSSLFYDLIKYTLRESFDRINYEKINSFESKTSKYFTNIRNIPK